jgi:hypothetical protein
MEEQLVIYLSELGLGARRIAKLHLHDSISHTTVLRIRRKAYGNFVPERNKNQDLDSGVCPECGGRVELRGDEYVCLNCGLVDEERSTVEGQARDIGLEIETHEPSLRLDFDDGLGSNMTDYAMYRVVGEKVRQVSSYIHDDSKLRRLKNELSNLLKSLNLGSDHTLGDIVGRMANHLIGEISDWVDLVSLKYQPLAGGIVYTALKLYRPRLLNRLVQEGKLEEPDDAVTRFIESYGLPEFMKNHLKET